METVRELREKKWENHKKKLVDLHEVEHFLLCVGLSMSILVIGG